MIYLDRNKDYNSFFKWKKHIIFTRSPGVHPLCDMCIKLHLERFTGLEYKYIDDIDGYWNNDTCKIPKKNNNRFKFLF